MPLGHCDLTGSGRSAILLALPVVATRGRPVGVVTFRLCSMLVPLKDSPDRLLTGGVVGGDVQELVPSARLLAPQFVDQGLAVCPAEERTDDVGVDDAGE